MHLLHVRIRFLPIRSMPNLRLLPISTKIRTRYPPFSNTAPKLENLWSIQFNKDAFRIWPDSLKKADYQKRHNNVLKLTNLPKGTKAYDLFHILKRIGAMTCYIPKKGNTDSYQDGRVAYIAFKSSA